MTAAACAGLLAACAAGGREAGSYGAQAHRFSDVRLGRSAQAGAATPDVSASTPQGPDALALTSPLRPPARTASTGSVQAARARLVAFLQARGFQSEVDARSAAVVTATRMSDRAAPSAEAVCGLRALRRPAMYTTTLRVQIASADPGVGLGVQAQFVELDQDVISGALSRRPCVSRGLLEAEVRRAVAGTAAVRAALHPLPH